MSPRPQSPQRHRLGQELRALRKRAGLTGPDIAALLKIGQSSVSRFERGEAVPSAELLERWAQATGATSQQQAELAGHIDAIEVETLTWGAHFRRGGLAELQERAAELETRASTVNVYQPVIIPGLLQAPEVVRHVFTARNPGRSDVTEGITGALARQAVLLDTSKQLRFVLGEVAIRWLPLPPEVVARQIDRLASLIDLPNVTIGILPVDRPPGVWATHGFVLFDRLDGEDFSIVQLELRDARQVTSAVSAVDDYRAAFEDLLAAADTGEAARALLEEIREDLGSV